MAINQILPFGTAAGANVLAPADYQALASRNAGFSAGTAKSKELNTVWRQASFVAAMLGQYIADKSGQDVLDNGDLAALQAKFVAALAASPAFTGTPTAPTPAAGDKSGKLATTAFVAGNFPRVCSIGALPTQDIGPIIVAECSEVWTWVSTQYYTGYRSPLCGRPVDGHTIVPLASEVDAVGGELSKTDYARLWGYARENNLVVSDAVWTANRGAHYFADVSGTTFRVPDLRNMFRRYTGTDADTANARGLASRQGDLLRRHSHRFQTSGQSGTSSGEAIAVHRNVMSAVNIIWNNSGSTIDDSGGNETRPVNTAYHPRIHV